MKYSFHEIELYLSRTLLFLDNVYLLFPFAKKIICKSGVMKLVATQCFDLKLSRKIEKSSSYTRCRLKEVSQNKREICLHELGGVQEKRCWKDNREYQHRCNSVATIDTKSTDSLDP